MSDNAIEDELQMVAIYRADCPLPTGKACGQAGHAFLTAWRMFHKIDPVAADNYADKTQKKIVLIAPDLQTLYKIIAKATARNVCSALIKDAAKTVLNEPTFTVLALGPMTKTNSNALTRGLETLEEFTKEAK